MYIIKQQQQGEKIKTNIELAKFEKLSNSRVLLKDSHYLRSFKYRLKRARRKRKIK